MGGRSLVEWRCCDWDEENMKMKWLVLFLFIIGCAWGMIYAFQCVRYKSITQEDRAEIIKRTLEMALIEKAIPDYKLIQDPENIVISNENIPPNSLPQLPGINLILLDSVSIQEKADIKGDFLYLQFQKIEPECNGISVSLDNVWVKSKHSTKFYLSGGGFTLLFQKKIYGEWKVEVVSLWIS